MKVYVTTTHGDDYEMELPEPDPDVVCIPTCWTPMPFKMPVPAICTFNTEETHWIQFGLAE